MANAEAAFNVSTVVGNEVTKTVSVEPRTQLLRTTHVVLREPSSPPGTHSLVTSLVGGVCVCVGGGETSAVDLDHSTGGKKGEGGRNGMGMCPLQRPQEIVSSSFLLSLKATAFRGRSDIAWY